MDQALPNVANWIIHFGTTHEYLVYAAILVLAVAEGPFLSIILGVTIRLGYFDFLPIYITLMIGDLIGDVIWYYIGYTYGHSFIGRHGKRFNITEAGVERITRLFHKHKHLVLFISKLTNGLGFAIVTLATAGMARVPFGPYMLVNTIGQLFWTGFLIGVGLFFSHLYIVINNILGRVFIFVLISILIILGYRYIKYLRTKAEKL